MLSKTDFSSSGALSSSQGEVEGGGGLFLSEGGRFYCPRSRQEITLRPACVRDTKHESRPSAVAPPPLTPTAYCCNYDCSRCRRRKGESFTQRMRPPYTEKSVCTCTYVHTSPNNSNSSNSLLKVSHHHELAQRVSAHTHR